MTTNDDGSSSGPLDDTPEMKRLLETFRSLPLDKSLRTLKKIMEAAGLPFEIVPLPKDPGHPADP